MALATQMLVTVNDYRMMPETGPRYQLIEGELFMSPAPNRYHQDITRNIEFMLLKYLERNRVGKLYHAPFDVFLNEHTVFQPDIVYVAKDRHFILTDAGAEGAPNLVIEILSDSTAELDKHPKRKVYAASGVEKLWIVDPPGQTVEVYFLQQNAECPACTHRATDHFTSPCFPGLSLRAQEIFQQ